MRVLAWILGALVAVPLLVAPAAGDVHVAAVPDKAFTLVMQGASFNGFSYPDTPLLEASVGDSVQFTVVVPLTAEAHSFHLHGHPWLVGDAPATTFADPVPAGGRMVDTFLLKPGDAHGFTVVAGGADGEAGDWMYHCHVDDHMASGMWGVFRVYPYKLTVTGKAPAVEVRLDRLGTPVDDATFAATLDGAPVPVHAVHAGAGRWTLHVPDARGVLALTSRSAAWGDSVARVGLGGAGVPQPTVRTDAAPGAPLEGHAHG